MHTISKADGATVSLGVLIDRLSLICLGTEGRLKRLNRFLMGADLIMAATPLPLKKSVEDRLLLIAKDSGLVELDAGGDMLARPKTTSAERYALIAD